MVVPDEARRRAAGRRGPRLRRARRRSRGGCSDSGENRGGGRANLRRDPGRAPARRARAWAEAKIASLEAKERDQGKSPELQKEIVALSTGHRVLSAYTALLVLETDADYARFNLDRRALADILSVNDGRLAWTKRDPEMPSVARRDTPRAEPVPRPRKSQVSRDLDGDEADPSASAAAPPRVQVPASAPQAPARARGEEGSMGNPQEAPEARMEKGAVGDDFRGGGLADMIGALAEPVAAAPAPTAGFANGVVGHGAGSGMGGGGSAHHVGAAPLAAPARSPSANAYGGVGLSGEGEAGPSPLTGKLGQVNDRLAKGDKAGAFELAAAWEASDPGDVLALVSLGEASEAKGDATTAARAYGSLIDLFPSRADLRRFAGERLEHVKGKEAGDLALDTFDKARRDRPDHPASHRLAAFARLRRGEYAAAFDILVAGLAQHYPEGRFIGGDRILREDLGLVAAAWMKADPARKSDVLARLRSAGGAIEDTASIRFVLNWETDANDVDFHIHDAKGGHAVYSSPHTSSGGDLYADVTTGYGPECFTVRLPKDQRATPYTLQAHYYSRGPMGYGMGKLEIIDHDGHGGLKFEERPFIVMVDHAFVDLGTVK